MAKKRKFKLAGFAALAVVLVAGLGSFALAQSGGDVSAAAQNVASRHVDYDVTLQVSGDLSAVNPKLQGLLPLNLTATGGADIQKGDSGVGARGDLKLGGLDQVVQNLASGNSSGTGQPAALGSMISGALSDVQFVEVDKDLYLKLAGSWYDVGSMAGNKGNKPDSGSSADNKHPDLSGAFPGGPKALLKDTKTVGQDNIDGVSTTHYTASIDVDKAITEGVAALNTAGKTDQAGKLEAARAQIIAAARQLDVEWWLDGDGNLRQAKVAIEVDPSGLASLVPAEKAGEVGKAEAILKGITSVKLNATVKLSHFGEDFQITKPDGNISPLKDLMGLAGFSGHNSGANPADHKSGNHSRGQAPAVTR